MEHREVACEQTGNYTCKTSNVYNSEPATQTFEMNVLCMYTFPFCKVYCLHFNYIKLKTFVH